MQGLIEAVQRLVGPRQRNSSNADSMSIQSSPAADRQNQRLGKKILADVSVMQLCCCLSRSQLGMNLCLLLGNIQVAALGISVAVSYAFASWIWSKFDPHNEEKKQVSVLSTKPESDCFGRLAAAD